MTPDRGGMDDVMAARDRPARDVLANIQVLRALAAAMVVIVHLDAIVRLIMGEPGDAELFGVGVDLFFIISGFIMIYTTTRKRPTPAQFLSSRVARIVPFYWVVTLAIFTLATIRPEWMNGTVASLTHLVKSLLFLPYARADGMIRPILFVGWSLELEMLFYVIFAATLMISSVVARIWTGIGILVAMVAVGMIARASLPREILFLLQPLVLEFALGMAIGLAYRHLPSSRPAGSAAVLAAPLFLICMVLCACFSPLPGWPVAAIPAAALVVAALVADRAGFTLRSRPLLLLGNASFALYLTHPLVTQAMIKAAKALGLLTPAYAPLLFVISMVGAILVGIVAHLLVEKPLSDAAHRHLVLRRRPPAPVPA